MKKWLIAFAALLALVVAGAYVFIPSTLTVSSISLINANENGTFRYLSDESKWATWWYGAAGDFTHSKTGTPFTCNDTRYTLTEKLYKSVKINMVTNGRKVESMLLVIPIHKDSVAVQWECSYTVSTNPFTRIGDYYAAKKVKDCMRLILDRYKIFAEKKENIYGLSFERTTFKDTLLISTKAVSGSYPSTAFINTLVNSLQTYASALGAKQTNAPIYNITKTDSRYNIMVALPIDKMLPDLNNFVFKKMIPGSFIVSTVKGGEHSVKLALQNVQQYFNDYRLTSMAINFQMLVTDRMAEPDSSKWITKLYQPVY